jgi:DNA-binding MarR family transcriptional regulator
MATKVYEVDDEDKGSQPLVGALLRRPFMATRAHIIKHVHTQGFADLQPASQLARSANVTKQAMNNLLSQLERAGYLTRTTNAGNRRERVIELTARGHAVLGAIRTAVRKVELQWQNDLGKADYRTLRMLLNKLNEVIDPG